MARNEITFKEPEYYFKLFEWRIPLSAKPREYADWEVFLNRTNVINSVHFRISDPMFRLEAYPKFVKDNLILLEDFDKHILGNIFFYEKKIVVERTIRLAYILVSLILLLLVPIGVAFINDATESSVPAQITAMFTGFFALYQGVSKWLEKRNVIGTFWQTKSNLMSRLLAIESKWRYTYGPNDTWEPEHLEELKKDLQEAVTFGLDSAKTEKQLFFDNYNYPQFNILGSIIGIRGQVQELFKRQETSGTTPSSVPGTVSATTNPRLKLAQLTEIADKPIIERNIDLAAFSKVLQRGAKGAAIKELQGKLGLTGKKQDGKFGPGTEREVIQFQVHFDLVPDGIVNEDTWTKIMTADYTREEILKSQVYRVGTFEAQKYFLPNPFAIGAKKRKNYDYREESSFNEYAFLHHTASGPNPYQVINDWGSDKRGRVATEFVLGGQSYTDGNDKYDGLMVQAFPEGGYAFHLGKVGNEELRTRSTGIEICSIGWLKEGKSSHGHAVDPTQIATLSQPFRGFTQYHRYSDKQLEMVKRWILFVADRDNIDVRLGLQQWIKKQGPFKAFEFQEAAYKGEVKGLLTHTNVNKTGKSDCYPDERLVQLILEL